MRNKFTPFKKRFRATFAGVETKEKHVGKIDKENEILHDVQIVCEGEAKGHGVYLDKAFCEAVAKQGNATGDVGVKVRFGHPAMCSDALGTYLGRAKNFRVVEIERTSGEKAFAVIADVHLAKEAHKAPAGDLATWVMESAENSPDMFGQSIVFTYSDWKVLDAEGKEHFYMEEVGGYSDDDDEEDEPAQGVEEDSPNAEEGEENAPASEGDENENVDESTQPQDNEGDTPSEGDNGNKKKPQEAEEKPKRITEASWLGQSVDGKVYVVLGKLHGTDFTDTPAATDGVFSANTLAAQAEEALRERPELLAAIEKNPNVVAEFLSRVGILDSIESNRVKGMQRAKDKQISELTGEISNLKNELTKQLDLASAFEKEISSLKAELAKERNHSAEVEEALTKEKENLLNVTGRALRVGKEKKVEGKTNRDRLASLSKIHGAND